MCVFAHTHTYSITSIFGEAPISGNAIASRPYIVNFINARDNNTIVCIKILAQSFRLCKAYINILQLFRTYQQLFSLSEQLHQIIYVFSFSPPVNLLTIRTCSVFIANVFSICGINTISFFFFYFHGMSFLALKGTICSLGLVEVGL